MKFSQSVGAMAPGVPLVDSSVVQVDNHAAVGEVELACRPAWVAKFLGCVVALLVAASLAGQAIRLTTGHEYVGGFVPKFNLDAENNVPTFFGALLLVAVAGLLALTGTIKRKGRDRFSAHWGVLSLLFLFLAFDEASAIHEALIMPLRTAFKAEGIFHYAWVIAAIPLVVMFLVGFAKFFFHLPKRSRFLIGLAVGTYIGGALGLELAGGWYADKFGLNNWGYVLLTTVEETLEMTGIVILIYGLLDYLATHVPSIRWTATERRL
jgi:hypothetical protein